MSDINQRTQKLASAIYFVTNFFADQEPLKWRLRELSADLVSERIKDKIKLSKEIISLFSIAKTANLISEGNFEILQREFSKFSDEAEKPLNILFPREFLSRETPPEEKALPEPLKDKITETPIIPKRIEADAPIQNQKESAPLKEFGAVSVKKNSRQSVIIGLLKRKKEIMIKDVSVLISGCSEKTIQRELQAMVAAGVLRKIGEKRWSRYTLA